MKQNSIFSFLCIVVSIINFGCSIPTMVLKHESHIENRYERTGSVRIALFDDKRLADETDEDQIAVNSLSAQIWSGATQPEMMLYFRKALIEEAEKTQIFFVDDAATFELSGYVTSMKVDRKVTIFRYLGPAAMMAGFLLSTPPNLNPKVASRKESNMTPFWIGLGVGTVMLLLDSPVLTARVEFHATLKQNGSTILEKDIKHVKEASYSAMSVEWSWQDVSNEAAKVLDQAITESIKILFDEISLN